MQSESRAYERGETNFICLTGVYLGNILEYALVDRGASGGSLHGSVKFKMLK